MKTGELLVMSTSELERLQIVQRVHDKLLTQAKAANQLGITPRQVRRLLQKYRTSGALGLISSKRGKKSNRAFSSDFREQVLSIIKQRYPDFGPTLIAEKLLEKESIDLSHETIRQWMIVENLWTPREGKISRAYQPRYRRDCFGELIQIDGSEHDWFEGRAPKCTLLVYIDDATSKLVELQFVNSESTFDYFHSTRRYIERYGKPIAFYSDKHAVFRVNAIGATSGTGLTQFGRALNDLNIDIIYANSSQAKGRVERMNYTLQDRLVKELRLENICSMSSANNFLPLFMSVINDKFSKPPKNPTDMHRPLTDYDNLDEALTWQEKRTVSKNLTIQYDRVLYLLDDNEFTRNLRRKRVTVIDYPDGTLSIKYENQSIPYSIFDRIRQVKQAGDVSNKRLSAALDFAKEKQSEVQLQRSKRAPKRRGQQSKSDDRCRQQNPSAVKS